MPTCIVRLRLAAVLFIVLTCATAAPLFALTGSGVLTGRVLDAQTGLPLSQAAVAIVGQRQWVATGAAGDFRIPNVPPGTYQLRVTLRGYQPADTDPIVLAGGQTYAVTIALQAAASGSALKLIGSATVKAGPSLQKSSTIYRTLDPETLALSGVDRAGDALRQLPAMNNGIAGDTAALADDLQLDLRGIGTLETSAALDGHPIAYGVPYGYNYQLSPIAGLRNIDVTYGSGSNLLGISAIGGIVDFQTLNPTPDDRFTFSQGYGTWKKAASIVQATGTAGHLGYAFAYGVASLDGPLRNLYPFEPGAAFDQSAPPGSPVYQLGIYKQDATAVSRSGLIKLQDEFNPHSRLTFTNVNSSYWNDKTGNGDGDYMPYAPALAFGKVLLSQYSPANFPKLPACPSGTFVATNANGSPNGFGPNGQPDGGVTCQTPQQYAAYNTGWDGAGPAWQSFNFNDYDLAYESTPAGHDVRIDTFTNRYLNTISRQDALPFITEPGDSPQAFLGAVQVIETGVSANDTILGKNNDAGAGLQYLNNAYSDIVTTPYGNSYGTPIDHETSLLLHDVYHPQHAPLTGYFDVNFGRSTATQSNYADPRATVVYSLGRNDAIRASAGATTTQPSGNELDQPFAPSPPGGAGGGTPIQCAGLNSIGSAPSSLLKPERGVDQELGYGHRFRDSSLLQATFYNVDVFDKLYQTIEPLSATGTAFIDPAYLAQVTAAVQAKCGAGAASLLGLNGTFNVGQLRARGLMLNGRKQFGTQTFLDYDWTLDSTALVSAPVQLLQANLTLIPGSQLPRLPLHSLGAALDHTFHDGIDVRYGFHWVSGDNTKSLPAYDFSDLRVTVPSGPGLFSISVGNLFNQDAFIEGLRYEGVPLALNQYATPADYAQYTGASATERFGLPYRSIFFNYMVQIR